MPRNIIIHTVTAVDGAGDLIYFFKWYKIYRSHVTNRENLLLIFTYNINNFYIILQSLYEVEPNHPIFEHITVNTVYEDNLYKHSYLMKENCVLYKFKNSGMLKNNISLQ